MKHCYSDDWRVGDGDDPCSLCSTERFVSMMVPVSPGERDSWGAIAGIVVLVMLVVLLLALLLLYRRRQKDKQANTPTVSFSTSRTVNSEYAIPGTVLIQRWFKRLRKKNKCLRIV